MTDEMDHCGLFVSPGVVHRPRTSAERSSAGTTSVVGFVIPTILVSLMGNVTENRFRFG